MRCITCGSELPEGAQVCPACGRARLDLPVSSGDFADGPPERRRHGFGKALVIVLLLLVAAAGAAHVLRGNLLSTNPPPAVHAKKPVKAHAPVQGASTSQEPVAAGEAPAAATSLRLYLEPYGGTAPNAQDGLDATRAAIAHLQGQGQDVAEVDDAGTADHTVHFVDDWHGPPDRLGDTIPVGLGDTQCDGAWTAYRSTTMQALAEQGIDRAMGLDPGADPPLLHDGPCQAAHGQLSVPADQTGGKSFRLKSDETVTYHVQEQQGHLLDACLVAASDWDAFTAGSGSGQACQSSITDGSSSAALLAGDYLLGIRCDEADGSCDVGYTLSLDEPADGS